MKNTPVCSMANNYIKKNKTEVKHFNTVEFGEMPQTLENRR
jgi:hypothetical protein